MVDLQSGERRIESELDIGCPRGILQFQGTLHDGDAEGRCVRYTEGTKQDESLAADSLSLLMSLR
jgi:hypothetical protein